jgi:DNA mismatch endonuclease (patch repair protein)
MSRIRGKDTKPEKLMRSLLHRAGYRFRLHDPKLPGKPDIVLKKFKAVVFVNGCYWHRHPGCPKAYTPKTNTEFYQAKFDATVERDRRKANELREMGWRVITVWECELQKDCNAVLENVRRQLGRSD